MQIVDDFLSPNLNALVGMIKDQGATPEELKLMGVLAIMDETLRAFAEDDENIWKHAALQTYQDLEEYILQTEEGEH